MRTLIYGLFNGDAVENNYAHELSISWLLQALVFLTLSCSASMLHAASPITSSGLNTQVTPAINAPPGQTQIDITGGTRPDGGGNLYHSFGTFNVPNHHIANFLNESGLPTTNILGRVTGNIRSDIFGAIQTTGFGNANLFLMNPAGFLFGPNATLNVGGMVAFTTADYLRLADGTRFNAIPSTLADALLTSAPVATFGFLGSDPGAITIEGSQFRVKDNTGISLVGGNITMKSGTVENGTAKSAQLIAPSGQVTLASATSPGEVSLNGAQQLVAQSSSGQILLSNGASIDTSGESAGRIAIHGGQLTIEDASVKAIAGNGQAGAISITAGSLALNNGALITTDSHGHAAAGNITLNVGVLTTQPGNNQIPLNPDSPDNAAGNFISADSRSTDPGGGPAGNITIQGVGGPGTAASSVVLKDSSISSRVFGGTTATPRSAINITADALTLTNAGLPSGAQAATIVANTIGPAPAGNIALNVNALLVNTNLDQSPIAGAKTVYIVTSNNPGSTAGPTGAITISGLHPGSIDPAQLVALNNTFISSGADGGTANTLPGHIAITTDVLSLSNDTGIVTATFGDATTPAGNIVINANTVRAHTTADGTPINGKPQVFIVSASGAGQAGNILISGVGPESTDAAKMLLLNNIELNTTVSGGSPQTPPASIVLIADSIHLTHSKNIKTDTSGQTPAGNIVFVADTFMADQGTRISSSSSSVGLGGNISITAGQSANVSDGSTISANSSGTGNAGNITINAGQQLIVQNSTIKTEAAHAGGGSIDIRATDLVHVAGSTVSTSVLGGAGSGGNITIDPNVVLLQNSQILANAVNGAGGNIFITTNVLLPDASSIISASSQFGQNGTIQVQSPISPASGKITPLSQNLLPVTTLLNQRCMTVAAREEMSSFIVAGRPTLPFEPGSWLGGSLPAAMSEAKGTSESVTNPSWERPEAGNPPFLSLRQIAQSGLLTQYFAQADSAGCNS